MSVVLNLLKKILGERTTRSIRPLGHGVKSWLAAAYYGFPSKKLKLIGINGTKGKTSTAILTGRLLNLSGLKTGYISTAVINTTGMLRDELLNKHKMTTIDGISLQKYLSEMVKNRCEYVVLETSSQGLEQNRHWGLGRFLITVFLNLFPEHLEAHGGLENYKKAKSKLFAKLSVNGYYIYNSSQKQLEYSQYMLHKIKESIGDKFAKKGLSAGEDYEIITSTDSLHKNIKVDGLELQTNFLADFEISNFVYAWTILKILKPTDTEQLAELLKKIDVHLPGRMEFVLKSGFAPRLNITLPHKNKVSVLVDYAHEPESMKQLLNNLSSWRDAKLYTQVIHILSSDGAGRDDWKKSIMGQLSFDIADYSFITTDNYDSSDDPKEILNQLTLHLPREKIYHIGTNNNFSPKDLANRKVITCINRKKTMQAAINLAIHILQNNPNENILICSVGVGAEQGLTQPKGIIDWDERDVWISLLRDS